VRAVQIKGGRSRDLFKFPSQGWYRFQLSPDGSHIAFSTREGLVVSRSNGTGKRNLKVILWNGVPSWSPDGRKIVIADLATGDTGDRNAQESLRIIDLASGSSREILFAEMDRGLGQHAVFSPDGKLILFARSGYRVPDASSPAGERFVDTRDQFSVVNADGTSLRLIAPLGPCTSYEEGWEGSARTPIPCAVGQPSWQPHKHTTTAGGG